LATHDGGDDEMLLGEALGEVHNFSLVTADHAAGGDKNSFSVHSLVHLAIQNFLGSQQKLDVLADTAGRLLKNLKIPPAATLEWTVEHRSTWRRHLPHAVALLDNSIDGPKDMAIADICRYTSIYLGDTGRFQEAVAIGQRSIRIYESLLGRQHGNTLHAMRWLAITLWKQGIWDEAEKLQREVLEVRKRVLCPEHPDIVPSMNGLANVLTHKGLYVEAEGLFAQILEIRTRLYGEEDLQTVQSLLNLSVVLDSLGRSEQAEKPYMKILDLTKTLRDDHAMRLVAMKCLGDVYSRLGMMDKALELDRKCLEISKRSLGEEHMKTLGFMVTLGKTLCLDGKLGEAEKLQLKALETFRQLGLNQHPQALIARIYLANTYYDQGHKNDDNTILEQTIPMLLSVVGEEHPWTKKALRRLARWKNST
jgi:tetratricopeptide (TPR) repeat protein